MSLKVYLQWRKICETTLDINTRQTYIFEMPDNTVLALVTLDKASHNLLFL
jgi:hypothetical protein